jgi:hypothetical protein
LGFENHRIFIPVSKKIRGCPNPVSARNCMRRMVAEGRGFIQLGCCCCWMPLCSSCEKKLPCFTLLSPCFTLLPPCLTLAGTWSTEMAKLTYRTGGDGLNERDGNELSVSRFGSKLYEAHPVDVGRDRWMKSCRLVLRRWGWRKENRYACHWRTERRRRRRSAPGGRNSYQNRSELLRITQNR